MNRLAASGCRTRDTRLVVEKPLGRDLKSAQALNRRLATLFEERQIYRIDHYLGKETVQNLMALRFANALFEPIWNARHVDHVQITVAERVGVGGRGAYYDRNGALRDMMQKPSSATALPHRHGAAGTFRPGCGARREAQGAAQPEAAGGAR